MAVALQGTAQTSPSPPPSAAATDEERGETKRARQRKRKDPEVVDERTMRMQKRMVGSCIAALSPTGTAAGPCVALDLCMITHLVMQQICKASNGLFAVKQPTTFHLAGLQDVAASQPQHVDAMSRKTVTACHLYLLHGITQT